MGAFFNKALMGLKRIPKRGVAEEMRKDYNREQNSTTFIDDERQKVLDRMAKARAARGNNA